jgi:hypothetical protein
MRVHLTYLPAPQPLRRSRRRRLQRQLLMKLPLASKRDYSSNMKNNRLL